jgi:hypothetical protein
MKTRALLLSQLTRHDQNARPKRAADPDGDGYDACVADNAKELDTLAK